MSSLEGSWGDPHQVAKRTLATCTTINHCQSETCVCMIPVPSSCLQHIRSSCHQQVGGMWATVRDPDRDGPLGIIRTNFFTARQVFQLEEDFWRLSPPPPLCASYLVFIHWPSPPHASITLFCFWNSLNQSFSVKSGMGSLSAVYTSKTQQSLGKDFSPGGKDVNNLEQSCLSPPKKNLKDTITDLVTSVSTLSLP